MPRTMSRLSRSCSRNFCATLFRCDYSMTKMMSAHSMRSPLSGVEASLFVPAAIALTPDCPAKIRSAVGLRSRHSLHTNSKFTAELRARALRRQDDRLAARDDHGVLVLRRQVARGADERPTVIGFLHRRALGGQERLYRD